MPLRNRKDFSGEGDWRGSAEPITEANRAVREDDVFLTCIFLACIMLFLVSFLSASFRFRSYMEHWVGE